MSRVVYHAWERGRVGRECSSERFEGRKKTGGRVGCRHGSQSFRRVGRGGRRGDCASPFTRRAAWPLYGRPTRLRFILSRQHVTENVTKPAVPTACRQRVGNMRVSVFSGKTGVSGLCLYCTGVGLGLRIISAWTSARCLLLAGAGAGKTVDRHRALSPMTDRGHCPKWGKGLRLHVKGRPPGAWL